MASRESFKIDKNDPDLLMFEQVIANFHPEFYALKQNGKPSYEYPDFWKLTLRFNYIPGNTDPYDLHALNLLTDIDISHYTHDAICVVERSISQQVKTQKQHDEMRDKVFRALVTIKAVDGDGIPCSAADRIYQEVKQFLTIWKELMPLIFESINSGGDDRWLTAKLISKMKAHANEFVDMLEEAAENEALNIHVKETLTKKQKFALLTSIFMQVIEKHRGGQVDKYSAEWQGQCDLSENALNKTYYFRCYPELIFSYEILVRLKKILRESNAKAKPKGIIGQSPSTFIHVRMSAGKKADDMRILYRWLFIKAWLYSYMKYKNRNITANFCAKGMAKYDLFFTVGEKSNMEDFLAKRQHTLNEEFSRWTTHYKKNSPEGYISQKLKERCKRHYWQAENK
ncbi:hypothetical protein ACP3V3_21425 [Vibrio sp. PNB22_3_1]